MDIRTFFEQKIASAAPFPIVRTAALRGRLVEHAVDERSRAAYAFLHIDDADGTVLLARAALHAGVPVPDHGLAVFDAKHIVRTDVHALSASGTFRRIIHRNRRDSSDIFKLHTASYAIMDFTRSPILRKIPAAAEIPRSGRLIASSSFVPVSEV